MTTVCCSVSKLLIVISFYQGAKMFQGPVLELERYPVKGVMIQTADSLAKLAQ